MKYVKFILSDHKTTITLPFAQAERVIDSPQQIVKIAGEDGSWTGETINKAHIIGTKRDFVAEQEYGKDQKYLAEKNKLLPGVSELATKMTRV